MQRRSSRVTRNAFQPASSSRVERVGLKVGSPASQSLTRHTQRISSRLIAIFNRRIRRMLYSTRDEAGRDLRGGKVRKTGANNSGGDPTLDVQFLMQGFGRSRAGQTVEQIIGTAATTKIPSRYVLSLSYTTSRLVLTAIQT